ncbi:FAD-dependent oxidoreductase [Streptomyces sp. Ru71]|uniref:NAD(P)/FAD-dependent oxidoreductase n=1 Tax=Streptomyces sp. Ru71 TaxID=2080746 RepID=UPI000CDE3FBC|nr:FAD-dependent oxidoreductase [Streptomyces sp. Ru71]POX56959.1 FAD-dependent oxidoreductase [Streptomyces sp. Ru71]
MTRTLVIAGHGMAGHRLAEELLARDSAGHWRIVILAEEDRPAYDRVALSTLLDGKNPEDLTLAGHDFLTHPRVDLRLRTTVTAIDRARTTVTCQDGTEIGYDALVLATGSRPFVPPVPGAGLPGTFVYRTVADIDAIRAAASDADRPAVVIGGGLLGLEAANGLRCLGLRPHVVEMAPRLMALQIDEGGARVLARLIGELGVAVHCSSATAAIEAGPDGRVNAVRLADGTVLEASAVVFAAGVRPRDELAEPAGLPRGERGGFLVDELCRTDDAAIWAIGECAAVTGRTYGLAAPGYRMAASVADQLTGGNGDPFTGADMSTKLKLMGVDVASFGDAFAHTEGAMEYVAHATATRYAKLVLGPDGRTLLGGVLAGDARAYTTLRTLTGRPLTAPPEDLLAAT